MFKSAVGHGIDPDSMGAIAEALEQCQQTLGDNIPNAGILIAAIDFDHEAILRHVQQTYPGIVLIGGTSTGEMSSTMAFQEDSVTLMLFCSDEVFFTVGAGRQVYQNESGAAQQAIAQATASESADVKLCYVLGDGLRTDGAAMVTALRNVTDSTIPLVGGLTADDWQLKNTYQFISTPETTEVLQDAIVVLAFSGNLKVSYSVANGQRPMGPKGIATKSANKTLYEINQQPAKQFYKDACGNEDVSLTLGGAYWGSAIAVYESNNQDFYIRTPHGPGTVEGSIDYFGYVPEQATVQLTECDSNSLLLAAKEAFQKARTAYPGTEPEAALIISCASRMKALGTRVKEEYELAESFLGATLPNMGFYSYGEVSPFTGQTKAHFHNETFIAVLLGTR